MVEADLRGWLPVMGVDLEEPLILEILAAAEDELREFVEVHGHDLEYMKAVWDSVEAILGQERPHRHRIE